MRHAFYFGKYDQCGWVVSSLDTVADLWKLYFYSIEPAWLNIPEPSSSDCLSPSQFSWWNVPPQAELSHSPCFAHCHLSSPETTSCRSLTHKNTQFSHRRPASCATSMHIRGCWWGAKANHWHKHLPVPEELCGITLVGAILWRASLGSSAATRAKRQIIKVVSRIEPATVHLGSLCPHCLHAAGELFAAPA